MDMAQKRSRRRRRKNPPPELEEEFPTADELANIADAVFGPGSLVGKLARAAIEPREQKTQIQKIGAKPAKVVDLIKQTDGSYSR